MRRLVVVLVVGGLLVVAGWREVRTHAQTPQQRVADARIAATPLVSVPVERGILEDTVTLPGQVRHVLSVDIAAPPLRAEAYDRVVTRVPRWPKPLRAPFLAVAVSGVPVVVVPSDIRFYRPIRRGDSGPDVDAVVDLLVHEGRLTSARPTFDTGAVAAFTRWWTDDLGLDAALLSSAASPSAAPSAAPPAGAPSAVTAKAEDTEDDDFAVPTTLLRAVPEGTLVLHGQRPRVGDELSEDQPLLRLGGGRLGVIAELPPADGLAIRVGDPVRITSGAVTGRGRVRAVDRGGSGSKGPGTVTVTLPKRHRLRAGRRAEVSIVLERTHEPVLHVPVAAVREDGGGTFVMRVGAARPTRVAVTTGTVLDGAVEVRGTGVHDGDEVLLDAGQP